MRRNLTSLQFIVIPTFYLKYPVKGIRATIKKKFKFTTQTC